jgi:hypothetical protein
MTTLMSTVKTALLEAVLEHIDIPHSYYLKAVARHKSLGEWLCRPESKLALYNPHVSAQGSFRYGTVVRPLCATAEYDLDNVTTLQIAKTTMTQKQLKQLYGDEVKAYARANNMLAPIDERHRCWRLVYADEVNFHLDTLPCVPEEAAVIAALTARGVPFDLARRAVAITDRRHPQYEQITAALLSSNPRGFAKWFEYQARPAATGRILKLVEARVYATVDDVPPYEWKTPLQQSIQLLKRHRDIMFRNNPGDAPISMIITNLAAHAYEGQADLGAAFCHIVENMASFVKPARPRVPNPTDPAEDYADKWAKNRSLEDYFWLWHTQLKADVAQLINSDAHGHISAAVRTIFDVELTRQQLRDIEPQPREYASARVTRSTPALVLHSAPKPWSDVG